MATGQLQKLRHEIRDIVGDGNTYNGLAGKPGLSFDQQRAEFSTIVPRVSEKAQALRAQAEEAAASLRARADELEAKKAQIEDIVAKATAIIADREADPNFAASLEATEGDYPEDEDDDDFDEEDFEEYDEDEEDDE